MTQTSIILIKKAVTPEEDVDFTYSRLDFEALTRSVGLQNDWFDPCFFQFRGDTQEGDVSPGSGALQADTLQDADKKSDGPVPFTCRLVGHSTAIGLNQGRSSLHSPLLMMLRQI